MKGCANTCAGVAAIVLAAGLGAAIGQPRVEADSARCIDEPEPPIPVERVVLTGLRTRDREVTVYAGDTLHFTVVDGRGRVLGEWLERDAFEHRFPELAGHFAAAFAGEQWLDARVQRTVVDRPAITGASPPRGTAGGTP